MHAISYGPTNHYPPCLLAAVLFLGGIQTAVEPTRQFSANFASIFSDTQSIRKWIVLLQFNNPSYKQEKNKISHKAFNSCHLFGNI